MAENQSSSESVRQRGTTSPKHTLEETIGYLRQIAESYGDRKASRESLAQALGHTGMSGAVSIKIGSLTHYGLLAREGDAYKVSPLGQRILHPRDDAEQRAAIREAAKAPNLYLKLFTELNGKAVPSLFENILKRDHGVTSDNAAGVVATFKATAEFAGLMKNGLIDSEGTESARTLEPSKSGAPSAEEKPAVTVEAKSAVPHGLDTYSIPLTKGRVAALNLPRPVTNADLERIKKWVDLMADVLTEEPETETIEA